MASNKDAIAAVNHWRGQCLDNFARAERAIIAAYSAEAIAGLEKPSVLAESAGIRTKKLAEALTQNWPKNPFSAKVAASLKNWSLREKQRNTLVHGCFSIKGSDASEWRLVNESVEVKKGLAISTKTPLASIEVSAFLTAIVAERKELETYLSELKTFAP